jgi:hypothetical protein
MEREARITESLLEETKYKQKIDNEGRGRTHARKNKTMIWGNDLQ